MSELEGKIALITGAASGIGLATAERMGAAGATVVIADLDEEGGRAAVETVGKSGARAVFHRLDVRDAQACSAVVETVVERFGRLDVAFNNAGISGSTSLTEDQGLELWQRVLDVNLTGVFNCMVPQLRAMRAAGKGAIVNTASVAGTGGAAGAAAYSASKHGVIGLTRTAALEYAKYGIRINAVCPGYIETPMTVGERSIFSAPGLERAVSMAPLRRMGRPQEIAEMVLWLCSDRSSYVTGGQHIVDGGLSAGF